MEALLGLFFIALVLYSPFAAIKWIRARKEEQERIDRINARHQRRAVQDSKKHEYDNLLNELERQPNNPQLRRKCLEAGRTYARLVRENGLETTFDELAIKNDIDAACAAAGTTDTSDAFANGRDTDENNDVVDAKLVENTTAPYKRSADARPLPATHAVKASWRIPWSWLILAFVFLPAIVINVVESTPSRGLPAANEAEISGNTALSHDVHAEEPEADHTRPKPQTHAAPVAPLSLIHI